MVRSKGGSAFLFVGPPSPNFPPTNPKGYNLGSDRTVLGKTGGMERPPFQTAAGDDVFFLTPGPEIFAFSGRSVCLPKDMGSSCEQRRPVCQRVLEGGKKIELEAAPFAEPCGPAV